MQEVTRDELNGLGNRLSTTELEIARMTSKVQRSENDIQSLFQTSTDIKNSVERGKWQVFAIVCVPVILLIIKTFI